MKDFCVYPRPMSTLLAVAAFLSVPAFGGGLREVNQTIFGMDCAPCAYGIEQGLKKLPGVTAVRVSLNEGRAVVSIAPDSSTSLAQIREVIRHNGFTPKDAEALIVGRVLRDGARWWIDADSAGRFLLDAGDHALETEPSGRGTSGELTLRVRMPETLSSPPAVQLLEQAG